MIVTCRLCGQIVRGIEFSETQIAEYALQGMDSSGLAFQSVTQQFMAHVGQHHADYVQVLAGTANTYHLHLVAKLAHSSDEKFQQAREDARALVYWTLYGEFGIEAKVLPVSHIRPIPKA